MVGRYAQTWWVTFLGVAGAHLIGQLIDAVPLQQATKPLLIPLLLAWFLAAAPAGRMRTLVTIALGWSWLGDLGLMGSGETWFLAGLGAFLVAQLVYIVAFWPWRDASVLRRPAPLAPYVLAPVALLAWLWPDLDDLTVPIAVYAVVIVAMAVLATGIRPSVAVGAALFVVSDALIAVGSLTQLVQLPAHGFWVMATYLGAQALIVRGVAATERAGRAASARG